MGTLRQGGVAHLLGLGSMEGLVQGCHSGLGTIRMGISGVLAFI